MITTMTIKYFCFAFFSFVFNDFVLSRFNTSPICQNNQLHWSHFHIISILRCFFFFLILMTLTYHVFISAFLNVANLHLMELLSYPPLVKFCIKSNNKGPYLQHKYLIISSCLQLTSGTPSPRERLSSQLHGRKYLIVPGLNISFSGRCHMG